MGRLLAQTTNAGFVPGNIWYSEDPFSEGDKIKIYTLIFNPDTRKFSGTVDFFDNSTLLGTKNFNVAATSTEDIYISWTVTAGDHQIYGQIQNAKFLTSSGTYIDANLTQNQTSKSSRTVASKVVAQNITNGINSVDGAFNSTLNSIQNIGSTAKNVVPNSVSQVVTTSSNTIDGFRQNTGNVFKNAQDQTQKNIDALNNTKNQPTSTLNTNDFQKPFDYVALFFLTILSFIFEYKILFYGIIIVIILLILRYIWSLIF
jgi:hypothetical protein